LGQNRVASEVKVKYSQTVLAHAMTAHGVMKIRAPTRQMMHYIYIMGPVLLVLSQMRTRQ